MKFDYPVTQEDHLARTMYNERVRLLPLIIVLVFLILIGFGVPQPLFATSSNVNVFATVPVLRCGDGVDNDGDGKTDYPNDPGCDATGDNDETDSAQATTDFYEQGVKPIIVFPRWAFVGATTTYEVEFPVDVAIPQEGKIVLAYPLGFSFTSLCATALSVPENNDLNGFAPGTVTIATLVCNGSLRTVTLTTAGASTQAGDKIRFLIQGIINSAQPRDYTTAGYRVDIMTKNAFGTVLESKTSQPFFLASGGSQMISGTVFDDNGSGLLGFANDGIKNGSEPGISGIRVCLFGTAGVSCAMTDTSGFYQFGSLSNSSTYGIMVPPLLSGTLIGGNLFRDITLTNGQSATGVNFALRVANRTITVNISGIPSGSNLDVFSFDPFSPEVGGQIIREVLWDGNTSRFVALPAFDGTWDVGVGPWAPKDPSAGVIPVLESNFMLPQSQRVAVSGSGTYAVSFALVSANKRIKGQVIDGSGSALPNAFVVARPSELTLEANGDVTTQSLSDGSFELRVRSGVYGVGAFFPGMSAANEREVTVKDDTSNVVADRNSTADIYSGGTLITNDGDGGADNLVFKITKGNRAISGRVIDDLGGTIAYAHVTAEKVDASGNPIGAWVDTPTDSAGNFTFYVTDGTWKLHAFASAYGEIGTLTVSVVGTDLSGQNIQASASNFGTVSGQVTKGGSAAVGAFVNVYGASGGNSTVTDGSGNYSLKVRAGSGYIIDGFLSGSGPLSRITDVTVSSGSVLTNQNLTISTTGIIRVNISGVSDAFVNAFDTNGRGNGTGSNSTAGVYDIDVSPGTYTVVAQHPSYGTIGSQSGVSVTGGNTTNVSFTPLTRYAVSGVVTSNSSVCTDGASVYLADETSGRVTIDVTDSSGAFSISVPNGVYLVGAGKPGCIDGASPSMVTVNGADVASGTGRTLEPVDASISGSVTLSGSNVAFDTVVAAKNLEGNFAFADVETANTSGSNYTLNLTPGTWTIKARSDGYESSEQTVTVISGGSQSVGLSLSAISGYTRVDVSSTIITPSQGGVVRDTNIGDTFAIEISAGVLGSSSDNGSVSTKLTTAVVTETQTAKVVGGKGIEITPKDASGRPITTLSSSSGSGVIVKVPYSQSDVNALGASEVNLVLAVWSAEKQLWEPLSTTIDSDNDTLTAIAEHFSTFAPIVPVGGGAPDTPAGLSATAVGSSQVNLSWVKPSNATGYNIYRDTSSGGSFPRIGSDPTVSSGDTISYSNSGLSAGTTYYYKVSAVNVSGESVGSDAVSITTDGASTGSGSSGGGGGGGGVLAPTTGVSLSGRAYPRRMITILKDAQVVATTIADASANFQVNVTGISGGNYIFSVYAEDMKGERSSLLTFPVSVVSGAVTNIGGIFIAPTISVDKSEVKRDENIAIFGQSVPKGEVTIAVSSEEEFFGKTVADQNGIYLYNFDTAQLDMGQHFTRSKAARDGAISSFSKAVSFVVGTKTVLAQLAKTPAKGDLNGDKRVNLIDFSIAAYWHKRSSPPTTADLNGDGKVNLVDFSIMAFYWTG